MTKPRCPNCGLTDHEIRGEYMHCACGAVTLLSHARELEAVRIASGDPFVPFRSPNPYKR